MTEGYYDAFISHPDPARRVGWTNSLEQAVRFEVVRSMVQPSDSLVDLGCGSGALLVYLRKCGWEGCYTGVDVYPHPFPEDEKAVWLRQDFTQIQSLDADIGVALGAMVGNTSPTGFSEIVRLLQQARRGFVFAGVHPDWLKSGIHDPALTTVNQRDIERCVQNGVSRIQTLESDLCLVRGREISSLTPLGLYEAACQRTQPTPGQRARVAVRLGLGEEIQALNGLYPSDEEVQVAYERWINKIIRLA